MFRCAQLSLYEGIVNSPSPFQKSRTTGISYFDRQMASKAINKKQIEGDREREFH
jgi:hypothetical protein